MKTLCSLIGFCMFFVAPAQITAAEYFIDTDPGVGNATAISITNGVSISGAFATTTAGLTNGVHTLYIRTRDADNRWSLYYNKTFRIRPIDAPITATNIIEAEYFIDTDPGVGNGNDLPITNGLLVDENFNFEISGLTDGIHTLQVRTKDIDNRWSLYFRQTFRVRTPTTGGMPTPIVAAEYFIDTDSGFESGTAISITPGFTINDIFSAATTGLDLGTHAMHIRVKDDDGRWSVYEVAEFEIDDSLNLNENNLNTITVYPNPANNFLAINDANNSIKKITIYSLEGQLISSFIPINKNIDISNLSKGVYLLKLNSEKNSVTKKIVKL